MAATHKEDMSSEKQNRKPHKGTQEAKAGRQLNLVIIKECKTAGWGIFCFFDLLNLFLRTSENIKLSRGNSESPRAKPQKSDYRVTAGEVQPAQPLRATVMGTKASSPHPTVYMGNEGNCSTGQPSPPPACAATTDRALQRIL